MPRVLKHTAFLALVVLAAGFAACSRSAGGSGTAERDVVATVNGKKVMMSEVDRIIGQQTSGRQAQLSPLELASARLQVLDGLLQQEVLFQRAEKEKLLPPEDEITQIINQQKQQSGITAEQYQETLRNSGQTEESLREIARKQLAIQKLLDKVVGKIDAPSDKEVEDFYNNNRARYVNARGVTLATIVVDPADNGVSNDAKGEIEAKNKIDIVYQRLKSGADFATVARETSEDPQTSLRGGDVGFATEEQLKQGGFPQELIGQFFNTMQAGDYTAPVQGGGGRWTIFKLTDKRLQSENLTLSSPDVRRDAAENILNQRKQILNAAFLEVAMQEADIVNQLAKDLMSSSTSLSSLRPAGAPPPANAPAQPSPAASASPAATTTTASPAIK
ncbi:MAG: SurA N-terminal domain-containing protein [Acidobacteriota bacterium]|nr:SurA N-terminal domain-containing protein [Acidobacteriota bacterium]